jgi:hypothetical protein
MPDDKPASPADADDLVALIKSGGFRRLVPDWWPTEFPPATRTTLLNAADGLRRLAE